MNGTMGLPGEDTAYRDKKVRKRALPEVRSALRRHLLPGEQVLGLFATFRMRRSISMLVVTDRRLITLGDASVGMPLVDDIDRSQITEVTIERHKVFSTGAVVAHLSDDKVGLGTLDYGNETFNALEEILARTGGHGMPLIPTLGRPGAEPAPVDTPGFVAAHAPAPPHPPEPPHPSEPAHPMVAQLRALADLHERGSLTDTEFAAAKEKLIAEY